MCYLLQGVGTFWKNARTQAQFPPNRQTHLFSTIHQMVAIQKCNLHVYQLHRSHYVIFWGAICEIAKQIEKVSSPQLLLHTSHARNFIGCEKNVRGTSHCSLLHAFCAAFKSVKRENCSHSLYSRGTPFSFMA